MSLYTYSAADGRAMVTQGTIAADSPRLARDLLRRRGLSVVQIREINPHSHSGWWQKQLGHRYDQHLTAFFRELATLLSMGAPILDAIDSLIKQHKRRFARILMQLRENIAVGRSLADSMGEQPNLFDPLCINIVRMGENAGALDESLRQVAEFKERSLHFKSKIGSALLYPAMVLFMAIGVAIFLMTYVVPKLLSGLLEAGRPIPLPTQIVKSVSDLLVAHGLLITVITATLMIVIIWITNTHLGRRWLHRLELRLPVIGMMIRKQAVVRLALISSTLLRSGMTFIQAIQLARQSPGNQLLAEALADCEKHVIAGQEIAPALERTGMFPPAVIHAFALGQQSGQLEDMLDRLASDYDRQLNTAAQRVATLLEPIMILIMVAVVGLIAFATILPMLEAVHAL